jgi:hypothetical protein
VRTLTSVLTLAMVGLLTAGPAVPIASADDPPTFAALVNACDRGDGVSGAVTDRKGAPVVDAPVMVHANVESTARRVELPLLGATRTDDHGCYHVPLRAGRQLASAADPYGVLNLGITLQRPDGLEIVNLPRRLVVRGEVMELQSVDAPRPSLRLVASGVDGRVVGAVHQSFGPQADRARPSISAGVAPDRAPLPVRTDAPLSSTIIKRVDVYKKRPVLIGQWFSTLKGVEHTWKYTQGATSTLGSVLKIASPGAEYERSQTYARSTSATVTFPTARGKVGKYYRSYFRYARYAHVYCDTVACGIVGYDVRPYKWERGTQVISHVPQIKVKGRNCSKYAAHSKDESKGSTAITWSDGVLVGGDLGREIGLRTSLSSRTGFTSEAQNLVAFGRRGRLCGWAGPLGGTPRILAARPWPR